MQKAQAQNLVKETFENPFNEEKLRYFLRNLLNHFDEENKHSYSGQFISTAFQPYISTLKRIGKYSENEHEIDILVVQLKKESSLERARTAQRNFIARYLNGSRGGKMKDAALVAFVSPNESDWRFSLIRMDYKFVEDKNKKTKVKEEFTPARRWSFLVGPNEHSHTAQSKLVPIIEDEEVVTLERLEEAFNIEKVTKEFFEKYRGLFADVKEELDKIITSNVDIQNDFSDKFVSSVDFSKRLLGQIVFLYFLQKKGWFGVSKDKKWGEGDKNFLRNLFAGKYLKYKNFYNEILEPLFYDALALERSHLDHWNDHFQCKIPFLNGGLFDNKYNWHETAIELPNELFSNEYLTKEKDKGTGILDIFDRYNFTVKEDEPLEKEVAVDPEMLGKVFENLLEVKDRKSKGTYYTPREIVHYMCEQSLVNYLATELEGKVAKEDLDKLIKIGENVVEHEVVSVSKEDDPEYGGDYKRLLPDSIKEFVNEIDDKLATIKVCDPAIGSGAFPVGMMNAIVKARTVLSSYLKDKNRTLYAFKRDCIQNSLYGVDIDPGAVEIAKLRLWLSLVVDEDNIKQIKPLPNLDYKIMQGNSLLEEFEGIKLFDEKLIAVIDTGKEKLLESLKQKQAILQKEYFELHSQNKLTPAKQDELNSELKKLQTQAKKLNQPEKVNVENAGLFDMYSEAKKKADDLKRLHKEFFEATQKSKKNNIKKQIEQLEWELIEATLKEQGKISALKKLEEFKRSNTKPFFLWKLNFADVFEGGGFNIVIANPPYVSVKEISSIDKKVFSRVFETGKGRFNLFTLFLEEGCNILKKDGIITFILPEGLYSNVEYQYIRKYLLDNTSILLIGLLSKRVFEAAVDTSIISAIKSKKVYQDFPIIRDLKNELTTLNQASFYKFPFHLFTVNLDDTSKGIVNKVLNGDGSKLEKVLELQQGIIYSGQPKEKVFSNIKVDDNYKKVLDGRDVLKWLINWKEKRENKYILYSDKLHRAREERIFVADEKILFPRKSTMICGAYDDEQYYCLNTAYVGVLKDKNYEIKIILGILNSKLINYAYSKLFFGWQVTIPALDCINLPTATKSKKIFADLVEKIIKITKTDDYLKNAEKQAKVRDIELQIDELVYKLYGLTEDEIKIVEAN